MGDQPLNAKIGSNGSVQLTSDASFLVKSLIASIQGKNRVDLGSEGLLEVHTYSSNLAIFNETGNVIISSTANNNPSMFINALNPTSNLGGIIINTGNGGLLANTIGGDINFNSNGANVIIGGDNTQNVIINADNNTEINTGDFNLVAGDTINIISITGNINIGTPNGSVLAFQDGNLLVNHNTSIYDRQVDINLSRESNYKPGYNGIIVATASNVVSVAAETEYRTSNTGIFSLGIQGTASNLAIYQNYLAYQNHSSIIPVNGPDFTYNDIGKRIHWNTTNRNDVIIGLGSNVVGISDSSNLTINGVYNGTASALYFLEIDSVADGVNSMVDTFKWSNNGGISYQSEFVPCSNTTPFTLDNGLTGLFSHNTGYYLHQQFVFYGKISALVENGISIPDPEIVSTLQPQYAYLKTEEPNDIVFYTNKAEKMRITGDGAIGVQTNHPLAGMHISSQYGAINIVNTQTTGYQINPHITSLIGGGYMITWASQNQLDGTFDILAQRYESDGSTYGNNFTITSNVAGNQIFPAVANSRTSDNTTMFVWSSNSSGSDYDVYGRIFQDSTPITADILINSAPMANDQLYPRISGINNGNFVVAWSDAYNHTGNVYASIISPNGTAIGSIITVNPSWGYSVNYPWVIGLSASDPTYPGGFIVSYLKELSTSDDRYTLAFRAYSSDGSIVGSEVNVGTNTIISSISDGLQSGDYIPGGGFILTYYQNYNASPSYYNENDNITGTSSGVVGVLGDVSNSAPNILPLKSYSGQFIIGEEIAIDSSVFGAGIVTERILNLDYLTPSTANITLDTGHKCVRAVRFESNASSIADATFNTIVNTSRLYPDLDRQNAIITPGSIFAYQRPLASVSVDGNNTALITWTNGSIPNIYYQLINDTTGQHIYNETPLELNGLKQRNPMVSYLTSIAGDDYGYTFTWDNQNLDQSESGIYNQIIGYRHDITRIEDKDNILVWSHQGQLGVGLASPDSSIHINERSDQSAIIKIQSSETGITPADRFNNITASNNYPAMVSSNNPKYTIDPRYKKTGIVFSDGNNNTLAQIVGGYSSNYQSLTPDVFTLRGYFNMDEIDKMALNNIAPGNTDGTNYSKFTLQNCDIETVRVPGIINSGILFNGVDNYALYDVNNYIDINTMSSEASNLSINIWIKLPSNVEINSHYTIITNGVDFANNGCRYELAAVDTNSNGSMYLVANLSSNITTNVAVVDNSVILNDNQWHNVGFTLGKPNGASGPGNVGLCLDGIKIASGVLSSAFDSISYVNNNQVYLGTSNGYSQFYRGNLDELRIYNKELSDVEVATLYNYGSSIGGNIDFGIRPLNDDGIIYKTTLTMDDTGSLLNINAKPRNAHTIQNVVFTSKSNSYITSTSAFNPAFNIGDTLQINNGSGLADYTVVELTASNVAIMDRPAYSGSFAGGSYYIPLCLPTIQRWCNEDDQHRASIDYYGKMLIGSGGRPNSLLELLGDATSTNGTIPYLTLTNSTSGDNFYDRKTGIVFRGNDGSSYKNLAEIEVSHGSAAADSQGIMRIKMNDSSNDSVSITASGYVGIGGQNAPLAKLHIQEYDQSLPSRMLLESSYLNYPAAVGAVFHEASEIYFAGQQSLTENNTLASNTLVKIVGSNDGWQNKPDGRIDFYTNNSFDHPSGLYLRNRMTIDKAGRVGVDMERPVNLLEVGPHLGNYEMTATSTTPVSGNTTVVLDKTVFSGMSNGDKIRLIGGSFIVNDRYLSRYTITGINSSDTLTVAGTIPSGSITSNVITLHYPGLNVLASNASIGLGTTNPNSSTDMNGSVSHSILTIDSAVVSTNYPLDNSHYTIIAKTNTQQLTFVLPDATTCLGRVYIIKQNGGANPVNIITTSSQTIDETSISYTTIAIYEVVRLQSDGSNWWKI